MNIYMVIAGVNNANIKMVKLLVANKANVRAMPKA